MGKLLQFARGTRPDTERADEKREAELIMFTGVRYERQAEKEDKRPDAEPKRESGG